MQSQQDCWWAGSQAHTLTKAWTERIDNAKEAKMINQDVNVETLHAEIDQLKRQLRS